ncbi:DUF924 family protein [Neorhizobium galegae]|uniref:DUF924 domain-containing protein n=1 Tax=Neorhizobium galegae TaxID=399 RepID=A0A6A1TRT1_NEOGA|nr:DUF924 family protein [Neorhizobium galegae]KAB1086966.1 DUF924 domain-containing protein [Neorhizobium galegae]CDZ46363.1 PF06041 family protein [Neorhizobium galegae bv. orientalis]
MAQTDIKTPDEVFAFWFRELTRKDWFEKNEALDEAMRRHFAATHLSLARGELDAWRTSPENRLAAVIVLDQLSRNLYRGTPLAFATDWLALREARLAIEAGADMAVLPEQRSFFYLPFEHSEVLADQDRSVELFALLGDADYLDYAERHRLVIREFGRFPHRNALLGRESTAAELEYLAKPGAGF